MYPGGFSITVGTPAFVNCIKNFTASSLRAMRFWTRSAPNFSAL